MYIHQVGRVLAAIFLSACAWSAQALDHARCGEQPISGGLDVHAHPESVLGCVKTGRIFCRLADDRDGHMSKQTAIRTVSDWLGSLNGTGSHIPNPAPKGLPIFADFVYARPELAPWTLFYQATYQCAAGARAGGTPEKQRAALKHFDAAASACEQRFPAQGDGRGNEGLRQCLLEAVGP